MCAHEHVSATLLLCVVSPCLGLRAPPPCLFACACVLCFLLRWCVAADGRTVLSVMMTVTLDSCGVFVSRAGCRSGAAGAARRMTVGPARAEQVAGWRCCLTLARPSASARTHAALWLVVVVWRAHLLHLLSLCNRQQLSRSNSGLILISEIFSLPSLLSAFFHSAHRSHPYRHLLTR